MPLRAARLLVLASTLLASLAWADPLSLFEGGQKVLTFQQLQSVAVDDPKVLDVKTLGDGQLLLIGTTPGKTALKVVASGQTHAYEVTVGPAPTSTADLPATDGIELHLRAGETRTLRFPALHRVAIGNVEVADVQTGPKNDELSVRGVKKGVTTLLTWSSAGRNPPLTVVVEDAQAPAPKDVTPTPKEELTLRVGQSVERPLKASRLAVGDSKVASAEVAAGGTVKLTGTKPGKTNLFVWAEGDRPVALSVVVTGQP